MLNSEHGGCFVVPRERDMVRLYAQLRPELGKDFDKSKVRLLILHGCYDYGDHEYLYSGALKKS